MIFEAPHRLKATLADIADALNDPPLAVCRELTKLHEEVWRGTASEALDYFAEPRGEFTIVIGPVSLGNAGANGEPTIAVEAARGALAQRPRCRYAWGARPWPRSWRPPGSRAGLCTRCGWRRAVRPIRRAADSVPLATRRLGPPPTGEQRAPGPQQRVPGRRWRVPGPQQRVLRCGCAAIRRWPGRKIAIAVFPIQPQGQRRAVTMGPAFVVWNNVKSTVLAPFQILPYQRLAVEVATAAVKPPVSPNPICAYRTRFSVTSRRAVLSEAISNTKSAGLPISHTR